MSAKPRGGVVEEEITVKTQYNNCGVGWELCGNFGGISVWRSVGYLLGSVMFTCDIFLGFVAVFCGKPPVADQWRR